MTIHYTLPTHWAPALVNSDMSGLPEQEIADINTWLALNEPGNCVSVSDDHHFARTHDASDVCLACDVSDFGFM
jgi:hypothetical protein